MRAKVFLVLVAVLAVASTALACGQEPQRTPVAPPGTSGIVMPSTSTPVTPGTVPPSTSALVTPGTVRPTADRAPAGKAPASLDQAKEEPVVSPEKVDGYLALAPAHLRSGQLEGISVSLFQGQQPARGDVEVALMRGGSPVANAKATIEGSGTVSIQVPRVSPLTGVCKG